MDVLIVFPVKFELKVGVPVGSGTGSSVLAGVGVAAGMAGTAPAVAADVGQAEAGPIAAHSSPVVVTAKAASNRVFICISPPRVKVTRQGLDPLRQPCMAL